MNPNMAVHTSSTSSNSAIHVSNLLNTIFPEDLAFEKSEFSKLSEECIFSIFAKLNMEELIYVSLCCKKFKRIANDQKFKDDIDLSKILLQLHLKFKEKDFSHSTMEIKIEDGVAGIFSFGHINPLRKTLNTLYPRGSWLDNPHIIVEYAKSTDVLFNLSGELEVKKYKELFLRDVFGIIVQKNINPGCFEIFYKHDMARERSALENQFYRADFRHNALMRVARILNGDVQEFDDNNYIDHEDIDNLCLDIENKIFCAGISNRFFFFEKDSDCFLSFRLAPKLSYDSIKFIRICDSEILVGSGSGAIYKWDKKVLLDYVKNHTGRIFAGVVGTAQVYLAKELNILESVPELGPKQIIQLMHHSWISSAHITIRPFGNEIDDYLFLLDHKGILKIYHLGNQTLVHSFHTKGYASMAILHGGEVALYKKGKIKILDFLAEAPKDKTSTGKLNRIAQAYSKKLFR